jgi:hypothetical protein
MSRRIRTKITNFGVTPYLRVAFMLTVVLMVALAARLGGVMAGVDKQTGKLAVYYLSPKVSTRTNMTPERLERTTFRANTKDLPVQRITELFEETRSVERQSTGRSRFVYDFRLCIVSVEKSVCFSGDGMVGYASSEPFLLSTSERDRVLSLFEVLDAQKPQ